MRPYQEAELFQGIVTSAAYCVIPRCARTAIGMLCTVCRSGAWTRKEVSEDQNIRARRARILRRGAKVAFGFE